MAVRSLLSEVQRVEHNFYIGERYMLSLCIPLFLLVRLPIQLEAAAVHFPL